MTALTEKMSTDREFWRSVAAIVGLVLVIFGGVFAIGGLRAAPLPQVYELIVRYVPGGLHTYGAVMVVLGFSLLHALAPRLFDGGIDIVWARYTLGAIWGFCLAIAFSFATSWALNGVQTWSAIVYWLAFAAIAYLCWKYPPADGNGLGRRAA